MSLSRPLTRREKVLLIILVLLLLCAVYFYFIYYPTAEIIDNATSQIDSLNTDITILQAQKAKMDAMRKELDELYASGGAMPIPDYDNLQLLMSFLSVVLNDTGDYTLSFPGLDKSDGSIVRRRLQMTFTAPDYDTARKILDSLQNCPYCCQLQNVTVTPTSSSKNTSRRGSSIIDGAVQVSLTMCFYENSK